MKSVYLLRHAKSSWSDNSLSDKERPLNQRGRCDAPDMGRRFAERDEKLERVVSSPAVRAHTTAELFCETCGFAPGEIVLDDDLYFLGSGSIEDVILRQDDGFQSLMLVFHNPDITWFANSIDDDVCIDNIPTAGLVKLVSDTKHWQDWSRAKSEFEYFDYPKNISGAVILK